MPEGNYYQLLGIRRDHPQEMIAQAFRAKIKEVHPDKYQMSDQLHQNKENAIQVF